jgi:hypothetical protein
MLCQHLPSKKFTNSNGKERNMPKPREKWQADVQAKLALLGMTQAELGRRIGTTGGVISQAMCGNYSENLRKKILKYLSIKE